MISIIASGVCFYRAETIRWLTHDAWSKVNCGPPRFTLSSCYDERWYTEDFLAVLFFILALTCLIYGVWLKKSDPSKFDELAEPDNIRIDGTPK